MKNSFQLTVAAKNDLKDIARYSERKWGRAQRNIYLKQFDDMFSKIAETPSIGNQCDYIKIGYRKFPQGSHVIFYTTNEELVTVIRILHKQMDYSSKLKDS